MKNSRNKLSCFLNSVPPWVGDEPTGCHPISSCPGWESSFVQRIQPISHLVPVSIIRLTVQVITELVFRWPLFYLIMTTKCKNSDVCRSDLPKRSLKVLLKSEKVKDLYLQRREKSHVAVTKVYSKNTFSICKLWRGKNKFMLVLLSLQTAKVIVHDKRLVKMKKAWNLYSQIYWEIFITVNCYNCSILLLVIIVNFLLCLIFKFVN